MSAYVNTPSSGTVHRRSDPDECEKTSMAKNESMDPSTCIECAHVEIDTLRNEHPRKANENPSKDRDRSKWEKVSNTSVPERSTFSGLNRPTRNMKKIALHIQRSAYHEQRVL